jgi:hypothetical protein
MILYQEMTMNRTAQPTNLHRMTATVFFSALALSFAAMCPAGESTGAIQSYQVLPVPPCFTHA